MEHVIRLTEIQIKIRWIKEAEFPLRVLATNGAEM